MNTVEMAYMHGKVISDFQEGIMVSFHGPLDRGENRSTGENFNFYSKTAIFTFSFLAKHRIFEFITTIR